uniref:Uncharacterized protein n=1 Tax=Meloidogyne enterolobii TaxID=390850 RepID=A0A6V7VI66_MELEN|nr:unnamed protein product [Meloidogyne enterolobii]
MKEMNENENFKDLKQFFYETPGALWRANYLVTDALNNVRNNEHLGHNLELETTLKNILLVEINESKLVNWLKKSYLEIFTSINENNYNYKKSKYTANVLVSVLIFDENSDNYLWPIYRKRILFFLEEIEEINNKNLEKYGNLYLNIINKFSKFINKNYTKEEMKRNLEDKSLEELAKEIINEENLNKFFKKEHSKMIKKLMEEDEIFKEHIEGL